MAASSRDEIVTRYRRLRAIQTEHHTRALDLVSGPAMLEQARRIGLAFGRSLVAESMDELTLAFDLALYTAPPKRSRAIDRYAKSARLEPGSDEAIMLDAMRKTRFSVWRLARRHETVGLVLTDLMRESEAWLVDENLERSITEDACFAGRLTTPDLFSMTSGVIVPVDEILLEDVLDEVGPRLKGDLAEIAEDRRFATAIYRFALEDGLMDHVRFAEPSASAA